MAHDESKKEVGWFEVRRDPRARGMFQWERVGLKGKERPVGSRAVEEMRRVEQRTDLLYALAVGRRIKVHPHMSPHELALAWRGWHGKQFKAWRAGAAGAPFSEDMCGRLDYSGWAEFMGPRMTPGGLVLRFFLPLNPEAGALWLSAAFGETAGRLRYCPCGRSFVRDLNEPNQRACDDCRRNGEAPIAGLPPALAAEWLRFQKRLTYEVRSGKITATARATRSHAAKRTLNDVAAGRPSLEDWRATYGPRTKRGRKPVEAARRTG